MIELSRETPPGQGDKHSSLFDNVCAATTYHESRRRHSEAQRRRDALLYNSCHDRVAYQAASLEDMSGTAKQQRERACVVEADAEHSKKALFEVQNQVGPLAGKNRSEREYRDLPGCSAQGEAEFKAVLILAIFWT